MEYAGEALPERTAADKNGDKFPEFLSVIFLPLVLVYFETLLRIFVSQEVIPDYGFPLVFGGAAGFLLSGLFSFFSPKLNKIFTSAVLTATGLAFAAECLLKNSFRAYMNAGSVASGIGGVLRNYSGDLVSSIVGGIPEIALFMLPAAVYIAFGKKLFLVPKKRVKGVYPFMSAVCTVLLFATGTYFGVQDYNIDKYKYSFNFDTSVESFGLITGFRLDAKYSIFGSEENAVFVPEISVAAEEAPVQTEAPVMASKASADEEIAAEDTEEKDTYIISFSEEILPEETAPEEPAFNVMEIDFDGALRRKPNSEAAALNQYVRRLPPSEKNEYTGLFKGKNLILICAEAFSDPVISEQLTPTLYRMTHNGFYFSDYYQPSWGGSTTTGEYSFVTGLAPKSSIECMLDIKDNNNYFTLGNQLQRLGYESCAFHNGDYDFYSRDLTHQNLGYSEFLATGKGIDDIAGRYAEDSVMFDKTLDLFIGGDKPFSLYYMTVSGHCVYEAGNPKVREHLAEVNSIYGSRYKDTTKYYICYQLELEKAMTVLINKLEEAGIADDTVICMTSDHYPYGLGKSDTFKNKENYINDLYGYNYHLPWEKDHNSWILWSGCLENELADYACEISSPTYSLDIVPTLSNLFGLEYDSRLLVGRDVFSGAEPLVIWNNCSWKSDRGAYNAADGKFYPAEGFTADKEYISAMKATVKNRITYSYQAAKCDYFGFLFGPDEDK